MKTKSAIQLRREKCLRDLTLAKGQPPAIARMDAMLALLRMIDEPQITAAFEAVVLRS